MRLFISLALPDDIKNAVSSMQQGFKNAKTDIRFVDAGQLHLTLQFLGDVQDEQLPVIKGALKDIQCKPFKLCLGAIGVLPNQEHIRIIFLDLIGQELVDLVKQIEVALTPFLNEERHEFLSHMTIARVKDVEHPKEFMQLIENIKVPELCFTIRRFALMESRLSGDGAEHAVVEEYKLL